MDPQDKSDKDEGEGVALAQVDEPAGAAEPKPVAQLSSKPAPMVKVTREKEDRGAQVVDVPYALWLATAATAVMASICLMTAGVLYLIDVLSYFQGRGHIFGNSLYFRMFELTALFGFVAIAAHFMRRRLEAMRSAAFMLELPFRVVANPPSSDTISKFECTCAVTLAIDKEGPLENYRHRQDLLRSALDNAFVVAVTDPVIRYSKARMEQTLKVAAHHVLGEGVSAVVISDVKQRRVPLEERRSRAATQGSQTVENASAA